MASLNPQARLFGLDLQPLASWWGNAWRDMLGWRVVRWLVPSEPVFLFDAQTWIRVTEPGRTGELLSVSPAQRERRTRRQAMGWVPDESLLLRWRMPMPPVVANEMNRAVELAACTRTPFAMADTCWAYEVASDRSGQLDVVLASRAMMEKAQPIEMDSPEVWVRSASGIGFLMLPGFGESARIKRNRVQARIVAALLLGAVGLGVALAMTPTLRLYLQAQQAQAALREVSATANKTLEARQTHVRLVELATRIDSTLAQAIQPVDVLSRLTQALPDDTYLRGLQASPDKITLNGETNSTAALMAHLGNLPGIKEVRAPQAASKPLGAQREQFVIELQLTPLDKPVVTEPQGAVPELTKAGTP